MESEITDLKSIGQTHFDTKIETKDGKLTDVSFLAKLLPYGNDEFFQLSLRDITESKKVSNNLNKKNTELETSSKRN